ncbi:hypothetical protein OIE68_14545 [Nocardia vinacea]|uniref:hypothetical protein n=1 Tax=Nocardia vinacea TaxID=96468 RepID=UPI002E141A65|nr:hypothetical protein OIE68_14545 [Nocardia vinacea]
MRSEARAFLVAVAAAGVLGVVAVPLAVSAPTTTSPTPITGQAGPCTTARTAVGESCPRPDPTFNVAPTRAERGTQITVNGSYWPCNVIRLTPSWSGSPQNASVSQGVFATSIAVSNQAATGPQTISAACGEASAVRQITIDPRSGTTTTTKPITTTTEPITTTTTQAAVAETSDAPTAGSAVDDPQRGNHFGAVLGIGLLLFAVGVATLVLRQRRKAADRSRAYHRDPRPPLVRVQVAGDLRRSIHIREFMRPTVPAVHVRLSVGEPQLHIREVSR